MVRSAGLDVDVTFHSSRAVLHNVDAQSLERMVADGDRNIAELADARVDVFIYACLVALMARGPRAHEQAEAHLTEVARTAGCDAPVVSSAGALIRTIHAQGAERVAIVTPYVPALTELVIGYIEDYGIEVVDSVSLAVADNVEVGRLDPDALPGHAQGMDLRRADLLIASCCVQMPSLSVLDRIETEVGLPVISAATASTSELLGALGLPRHVAAAGSAMRPVAASGDGSPGGLA